MRLVVWLIRAMVFFALFAFAVNNQHTVSVVGLFGWQWQGPMVWVVLLVFALGAAFGVLAMLPAWWRARAHLAAETRPAAPDSQVPPSPGSAQAQREALASQPPRLGL